MVATSGWDQFISLGQPSKFQRVSRLGFVTAARALNWGQPNFARSLAIWAGTLYIHYRGLLPHNRILSGAKFTLRPNLVLSCIGSITAQHSSSGHQPDCGVEQRAPPIFGRAAITLGIGPHSSLKCISEKGEVWHIATKIVFSIVCGWSVRQYLVDFLRDPMFGHQLSTELFVWVWILSLCYFLELDGLLLNFTINRFRQDSTFMWSQLNCQVSWTLNIDGHLSGACCIEASFSLLYILVPGICFMFCEQ